MAQLRPLDHVRGCPAAVHRCPSGRLGAPPDRCAIGTLDCGYPRFDDEDLRKLSIAPDHEEGYSYRQRDDGSWSLVGSDGWEVEFAEPDAEVISAIATAMHTPIDVDPVSVSDTEIQ